MVGSALDTWNYVLFSLECVLNLIFIPLVFLIFYICISQNNLHLNFRITLFLIGVAHLILDVARLIIVASRICCVALENPPSLVPLFIAQGFSANLAISAWLIMIIERAVASVYVIVYEIRFKGYTPSIILCGTVLLLTALLQCLTTLLLNTAFINAFIMGLQIGTVILSFANREEMTSALLALPVATFDSEQRIKNVVGRFFQALIVIIVFNKSSYNKRHDARIHLNSRYHLDENIRVGRYLIPVACNDLLTKVIFSILISYSVFFTDIPLGRDTTHLSHAYDLLSAYQRLFFGLALTLRSEKFDRIMRRHNKTTAVVQKDTAASYAYYDDLRRMW